MGLGLGLRLGLGLGLGFRVRVARRTRWSCERDGGGCAPALAAACPPRPCAAAADAEGEGGGGIASASVGCCSPCLPRSPGGVRSLVRARSSKRPGAASTRSVWTDGSLQHRRGACVAGCGEALGSVRWWCVVGWGGVHAEH